MVSVAKVQQRNERTKKANPLKSSYAKTATSIQHKTHAGALGIAPACVTHRTAVRFLNSNAACTIAALLYWYLQHCFTSTCSITALT